MCYYRSISLFFLVGCLMKFSVIMPTFPRVQQLSKTICCVCISLRSLNTCTFSQKVSQRKFFKSFVFLFKTSKFNGQNKPRKTFCKSFSCIACEATQNERTRLRVKPSKQTNVLESWALSSCSQKDSFFRQAFFSVAYPLLH